MATYQFEPEFTLPPPRQLPEWYHRSSSRRKAQRTSLIQATLGVLCLATAHTAWVQQIGQFIIPFEYLDYIGVALLLLAVVSYLTNVVYSIGRTYLTRGLPLAAKVQSVSKVVVEQANGVDSQYAIVFDIEYQHPETKELTTQRFYSNKFLADLKQRYSTRIKAGDSVSLVYLPKNFDSSVRVYGFLGLNPEREFVIDAKPSITVTPQLFVIAAFFAVLLNNMHAIFFFAPIDFDWATEGPVFLAIGTALSIAIALYSNIAQKKAYLAWQERNQRARSAGDPVEETFSAFWGDSKFIKMIVFVGGCLMFGLTILCTAFTYNALLDSSPAQTHQVEVKDLVRKVHQFIFRQYQVKYISPFTGQANDFSTSYEQMDTFLQSASDPRYADAEIRAGALGWRWVSNLKPK